MTRKNEKRQRQKEMKTKTYITSSRKTGAYHPAADIVLDHLDERPFDGARYLEELQDALPSSQSSDFID